MEGLNKAWEAASQEIYAATQAAGGAPGADAGQQQAKSDSDVADVEYEEVK
jgi:molecular chaperone DnaK